MPDQGSRDDIGALETEGHGHSLLGAAFDRLPTAAWVLDANGVVKAWNAAAEQLLGWKPEEVVGKARPDPGEYSGPTAGPQPPAALQLAPPADRDLASSPPQGPGEHRQLMRTRCGGLVPVVLTAVPLEAGCGAAGGTVVTARCPGSAPSAPQAEETGLPGRAPLLRKLEDMLAACCARTTNAALALVRLDGLADVAATFGHEAGTKMLLAAAGRLAHGADGAHFVGQLGEETLGILVEAATAGDVAAEAKRLGAALRAPVEIEGRVLACDASTGFALAEPGMEPSELQRRAETALAHSRQAGRGQAAEFSPAMAVQLSERLETESALRRALSGNELLVHYQPIVDLESGHLVAVEALLRWNRPGSGLIPPDAFIPLAERSGLIVPIGRWVLETSCADAVRHSNGNWPAEWAVSVNLSVRQLQDDRLPRHVAQALERSGLPTERLQLEVTESMLAADPDAAEAALGRLKRIGVRIALDDFGTGYASLASLRRYPFDVLKIDKSFVSGVNTDPDDAAIVIATLKLAHSLGLCSVAEGVETPDQLEFLRRHGCDKFQGFLFSRPQPMADLGGLLLAAGALRPAPGPGPVETHTGNCS